MADLGGSRLVSAVAGECVHELVAAQAVATPSRLAIEDGAERLSYRELERRSRRLAAALRCRGVTPGDPVGLALDRTVEHAVAVLAVLRAGAACLLLLDPSWPPARTAGALADAGCALVLVHRGQQQRLGQADHEVLLADDGWPAPGDLHRGPAGTGVTGDSLAYLVYTSGASGTPKGVMLPHRSFARGRRWAPEAYDLTADDRGLLRDDSVAGRGIPDADAGGAW